MNVLRADGVAKSFNGRCVVDSVSLEIKMGEVVGLLGPNGAGKTTTFRMMVGLIRPDSGKVFFNEEDITLQPLYQRARSGISYLPQESSVFRRLTVEENLYAILETLSLTGEERGERAKELMATFGIAHLAQNMAYSLSGGERRRVEIARALILSPSFILLDEPFTGVDPIAVSDIQNTIRDLSSSGIGILITDHNVRETLGICQRAYILTEGVILEEGSADAITSSPRARRVYLGEGFRL